MSSVKMHCFGPGEQFLSLGRRWGEEEGAIKSSGTLSLPGLGWQLVNHRSQSGFISCAKKQSCVGREAAVLLEARLLEH